MAKKEQPSVANNNVNNNTNVVNVRVQSPRSRAKQQKKPHWLLKAIVVAILGVIAAIFIQHATSSNGKPAYIQSNPK